MYYVARMEGGVIEADEYCHDFAQAVALKNELNETEEWGEWVVLWETEDEHGPGAVFEMDDYGNVIVHR